MREKVEKEKARRVEGKSTNRRDSKIKQMNKYQSRKELAALWHSLCTLLLRRETASE